MTREINVSAELAEVAYYVGVTNGTDLQVFAVGSTPENCEKVLKGYPGLLANPTFKVGTEVSRRLIEEVGLKPDDFRKVV
ncbi:hypothetical protein [Bradyrhizobium manausense]|uniref:hypothetical protein n=1 Tax=Bradyrhizobium manausense TaxID=989370 RepID=UPI0012EEB712|nr:hypothetical protein [Bradyrhizobium manausense]